MAGVTTAYGSPVYCEPPLLMLPGTEGGAAAWSVIVRRPGERPLLSREIEALGSVQLDLFEGVDRPLLGPYQVLVRGPLGRGLSRQVELVEDLRVRANPPWREFSPRGLVAATIACSAAEHVALRPPQARLGADEQGLSLEVVGGGVAEVLQVVPPHMAAEVLGGAQRSRWSAGPIQLETETVGDLEAMTVRVPPELSTVRLCRSPPLIGKSPAQSCIGRARAVELRSAYILLASPSLSTRPLYLAPHRPAPSRPSSQPPCRML